MLSVQAVLVVLFITTAFFVPFSWGISAIGLLFFIGAILSATHDTAIDGFYLVALNKGEQARFVGYRVMAYRIAMMAGTGGIVTIGTKFGWYYAFMTAGILLGGLFFFHILFLPKVEVAINPLRLLVKNLLKFRLLAGTALFAIVIVGLRFFINSTYYADVTTKYMVFKELGFSDWISIFLFFGIVMLSLFKNRIKNNIKQRSDSVFVKAFLSFIDRDHGGILLSFIILLRAGEFLLSTMSSAFMVDLGIKLHIGWITAGIGLPASIAGALLGGWLISKFTLKKMMLPFILAQNLTNLLYMVIALIFSPLIIQNAGNSNPIPIGLVNLISVAAVHGFDQFSGGLGTSVLMTFLMRTCFVNSKQRIMLLGRV
ncbi:MAG: AmpG family muropeptide MFS transporter [Fibrobacter sp.]|nr:AmpG family muropeptide MFS transporter [Fibrobacter sp.]